MPTRDVWSISLMRCAVTIGLIACSDPAIDDATPGSGLPDDPPGPEAVAQPIGDADGAAIIEPIHFIGRFDMTDPKAPVFE